MSKKTKLQSGQTAPTFKTLDIYGKVVNLADYSQDKLLICFFRYAGCPLCNLAIHRLTLSYSAFEKLGLKVLAFIQSEPENIKHYIVDRHEPAPQFPLIADPKRSIYDLYGVEDSMPAAARSLLKIPAWVQSSLRKGFKQGKIDGSLTLVPAQFLIGPTKLQIYKAFYGINYYDSLPIVEIMDFAQFGGN